MKASGRPGIRKNAAAGGPLFSDSMNRADAPTLGPLWTPYTTSSPPVFSIVSNKAKLTTAGGGADYAPFGTGSHDAALHDLAGSCPNLIDLTVVNTRTSTASFSYIYIGTNAAGNNGIGLRYDSSATTDVLDLSTGLVIPGQTNPHARSSWTAGSMILRATYNRTTGAVTVYENGVSVISASATAGMTGTLVGFGSGAINLDTWDDLVVA